MSCGGRRGGAGSVGEACIYKQVIRVKKTRGAAAPPALELLGRISYVQKNLR